MSKIMSPKKFEERFYKHAGFDYEIIGEYTGKNNPVMIRHKICQTEFPIIPHYYKLTKCLCPNCRHSWRTHDDFLNDLKERNANCISNETYIDQSTEMSFTCLSCGNIFFQTPKKLLNQLKTSDTPCPICNKGISYPEKFMMSFLKQIDANFIYQYNKTNGCDWSENYRYDFYLIDFNTIIEVHGIQHYRTTFKDISITQYNDQQKYELAVQHGCKYIVIDARRSSVKYISNNILKSDLALLFDLSNIDWDKCSSSIRSSTFNEVCQLLNQCKYSYQEIADICHISAVTVGRYAREAIQLGIHNNHDEYIEMIHLTHNKAKPVRCIEDDLIFDSARDANEYFGKTRTNTSIYDCLKGKTKTAYGKHLEYVTQEAI